MSAVAGDLKPPRPRLSETQTRVVTGLMYVSILSRLGFLVYSHYFVQSWWQKGTDGIVSVGFGETAVLWAVQIEMMLTVVIFLRLARWEDQGHLVTLWQALYTLEVLVARQAFYNDVTMFSIAFIGLYATYLVGIYTEFTKSEPVRLPPFPPKKNDIERPRYGWLGKTIARTITFKCARIFVTMLLYTIGLTFSIFIIYAFLVSEVDNLRQLPAYMNNEKDIHALTPLLLVAIVASVFSMVPSLIVESGAIPGLVSDMCSNKYASRSYRTGVWDVCELDEDKDGPGPDLRRQMEECGKLLDMTVMLPCYLPNEEEILEFVWKHYMGEFEKLAEYEKQLFPEGTLCKKEILVVWNSPNGLASHPNFPVLADEWKMKYKKAGFCLRVEENPKSTSKCDNLNFACDMFTPLIQTEMCCLNDADTMLDWSCMVRGSNHISKGYDIAQAMNSHCLYDCRGTPGDDKERQCHPYGVLITIGDATKPQNMSTQTPFKHAPFNGRGGFWKTTSACKVGFDHRTVGEDHDAGYRGCAYFGMKGILDMNMLCQEQEPPNCSALTSQRIRWETAALEMRRTFSWIIRSPHYTNYEIFVLLWSQLQMNCNLPLQALPFQVATAIPLIVLKGWVMIYAFGEVSDTNFCAKRECTWSFHITNPANGNHWIVALPLPMVIFVVCGLLYVVVNAFDFGVRVVSTRYRPRIMFFVYYGLLKSLLVVPFFVYVQFWALYDYCWGGAKFIPTARSPLSPKKEDGGGLQKPLLPK